jgi:RNA polymerase sigma factor (sigma-70 family)
MSPIQHFLSQIRGVGNYSVMSPTGATTSTTAAESTDAELLAAFAARRDERAFVILVARYSGLVRGTAQRRIGDAHLAEDVAQVAFSLLARRADALRNVRCLGAWLHRVTVLQSARELRSMARERRKLHKAMNQARIEEDACDPWQETWPFIDEALDALPPSDREVLVLRYYERLGFAEVSSRLGRSEAALRQQAVRALEKLSNRLRRHDVHVPMAGLPEAVAAILPGPETAQSEATALATAALAGAPAVSLSTILSASILTMSTAKLTATAAIAAALVAALPLGWQQIKINSARASARRAPPEFSQTPVGPGPVTPPSTTTGAVNPSKYPRPTRSSAQPPPSSEPAVDQLVAEHFSRRAGAEAARTALALGLTPSQTDQFRDFLERLYRERADAGNDEDRARYRKDERRRTAEFLATIAGDAGAERYRALRDEREAAVLERVAGDALYEFARRIDLTEEQKQRLFEAFAVAARTDAESGRQSSLQVSFGYGLDAAPRLEANSATIESVLTPEQLALWNTHGQTDPDAARKALGLVAPMILRDPDLLRNFEPLPATEEEPSKK